VHQIRTSIFDLHVPVDGVDTGLRRRLLEAVAEAATDAETAPTVRIAVVREAVGNAIRHDRSSSVTVTIEAAEDLLIEVVGSSSVGPLTSMTAGGPAGTAAGRIHGCFGSAGEAEFVQQ
jgi:hypothetical protein